MVEKLIAQYLIKAEVAQLAEQRIRNAWVGGSIPPFGTNTSKKIYPPSMA